MGVAGGWEDGEEAVGKNEIKNQLGTRNFQVLLPRQLHMRDRPLLKFACLR